MLRRLDGFPLIEVTKRYRSVDVRTTNPDGHVGGTTTLAETTQSAPPDAPAASLAAFLVRLGVTQVGKEVPFNALDTELELPGKMQDLASTVLRGLVEVDSAGRTLTAVRIGDYDMCAATPAGTLEFPLRELAAYVHLDFVGLTAFIHAPLGERKITPRINRPLERRIATINLLAAIFYNLRGSGEPQTWDKIFVSEFGLNFPVVDLPRNSYGATFKNAQTPEGVIGYSIDRGNTTLQRMIPIHVAQTGGPDVSHLLAQQIPDKQAPR